MGCVSSNLLNQDDELTQLGSSALSHHIVSLTSTTYGLLTLDPPTPTPTTPPTPPPRFTLSEPKPIWSDRKPLRFDHHPEIINWPESTDSFRFSPPKPNNTNKTHESRVLKPLNVNVLKPSIASKYEALCPPSGENKVVIYTTTLRGVRKTFEACNAVRSAVESFGITFCERDVSMDKGFREELRELMKGKERDETVPPRVFVKGRYVGGVEEVLRVIEEGCFGELVEGVERKKVKGVCQGCGDVRFLPCFRCNGSCKLVMMVVKQERRGNSVVVRCSDCNENGLVLCPICT